MFSLCDHSPRFGELGDHLYARFDHRNILGYLRTAEGLEKVLVEGEHRSGVRPRLLVQGGAEVIYDLSCMVDLGVRFIRVTGFDCRYRAYDIETQTLVTTNAWGEADSTAARVKVVAAFGSTTSRGAEAVKPIRLRARPASSCGVAMFGIDGLQVGIVCGSGCVRKYRLPIIP
jgi:hypothetical protein